MNRFHPEHILELECGHRRAEPSDYNGRSAPCVTCARSSVEVARLIDGYAWQCMGCGTSRRYGLAQHLASTKATAHARKYPGHQVLIKLGNKVVSIRNFSPQDSLDSSEPPSF